MKTAKYLGLLAWFPFLLNAQAAQATTTTIYASGAGWTFFVSNGGEDGNQKLDQVSNYFANVFERNWFHFVLPEGEFASAAISIWSPLGNEAQPSASGITYDLHLANDITFDGLGDGPVLATALVNDINGKAGSYINLDLSGADSLSALNSHSGQSILFGGSVSQYGGSVFGFSGDEHIPYLTLTTRSAVPEPATWAMFIGGFGLIGGAMRRRQRVSVRFA